LDNCSEILFLQLQISLLRMAKFHILKTADIKRETADCVSIAFDVPEELKADYNYIQGQYLTLKLSLNGEEFRRCYSLCSSPLDDELRIAAKEVPGGAVSPYLNNEMKAGDEMEVMTPMGNFHTELDSKNVKNYLLFAGGSGITPIISIIKSVLYTEPNSSITLFYANRDQQSIIFKEALESLSKQHSDHFTLYHILAEHPDGCDSQFAGIMTTEKVRALIEGFVNLEETDDIFICGPGPMMDNIKQSLSDANVPESKIHIEYFTVVMEDVAEAEESTEISQDGGGNINATVTVILDDEEFEFELATEGEVILEAAAEAGADVPFSCKGGVCCTCKAKLLEGTVQMEKNFALTDGEVEQGFILTCQSHPTSAKLLVSYDELF